jgi:hypothetical protein
VRTTPLLLAGVLGLTSLVSAFAPGLRRDKAPSTHAPLAAQDRQVFASAQSTQTFVGTITDDMCATKDGHATMRMGPTDAECTKACVAAHGAEYVLADGTNVYTLSDQQTPEKFAGQRVRVAGTLDAKTKKIQVQSISTAK